MTLEATSMTWTEALRYATSPMGVGVIAGLLMSWLAEYSIAFTALEPKAKRIVFLAACMVIPLAASLLAAITGQVTLCWDPTIWGAIVTGITAFTAGTMLDTRSLPTKAERDTYDVFPAQCGDDV